MIRDQTQKFMYSCIMHYSTTSDQAQTDQTDQIKLQRRYLMFHIYQKKIKIDYQVLEQDAIFFRIYM